MTFPTGQWTIALIFMLALILVARFRKQICSVDSGSYKDICSGLIILALFQLAKVYHALGLFNQIPFVSEATFFQLLFWIGNISGMVLLVHGVSTLTPLARHSRRASEARLKRLEFLRQVEQLVGVENRLDKLLEGVLGYIVEAFDLSGGSVHKYSRRSDTTHLVAATGNTRLNKDQLAKITFNREAWDGQLSSGHSGDKGILSNLPHPETPTDHILPVVIGGKPVGIFVLWCKNQQHLETEDHLNLKIATDIIARKIISDRNSLRHDFFSRCERLQRQMQAGLSRELSPRDGLSRVARLVSEYLDYDLLSLTLLEAPGGSHRRLSIGPSGALLDEKGLAPSDAKSICGQVSRSGQILRLTDISSERESYTEDLLSGSNMSSVLSMPIHDDYRVVAVLTLAHVRPGHFRQVDVTLLKYVAPALVQLIRDEHYRETTFRQEKRISKLSALVEQSLTLTTFNQIANAAVRLLTDELGTCQVRLSLVEDGGAFLKSCALASCRPVPSGVPVDGRLILSLMPCHRLVLDTLRPVVVNQDDDGLTMPEAETSQALNEKLSSALLVPISIGKQVVGIISIAEMRNWQRFRFEESDMGFCEAIAQIMALSLAHKRSDIMATRRSGRGRLSQVIIDDSTVRSQVRSSLNGILGSLELLRSDEPPDQIRLERYLSIIDRSAQKISECLTEEAVLG